MSPVRAHAKRVRLSAGRIRSRPRPRSAAGPSSFVKRMASQVEKRAVDDGPASFRSIDGTHDSPPPAAAPALKARGTGWRSSCDYALCEF